MVSSAITVDDDNTKSHPLIYFKPVHTVRRLASRKDVIPDILTMLAQSERLALAIVGDL